jgi:hypothetical protein
MLDNTIRAKPVSIPLVMIFLDGSDDMRRIALDEIIAKAVETDPFINQRAWSDFRCRGLV